MALNQYQQLLELLKKSNHILIVTGSNNSGDALASGLALKNFLTNSGKIADIASLSKAKNKVEFLDSAEKISNSLNSLQKLIINLDISKNQIQEFNYDIKDEQLKIYVTPKNGRFEASQVTINQSEFKYDLIITLGASDLAALGNLYDQYTDFFYETPIINIDCETSNEHFGQINIIDINACSVSEIIFEIMNGIKPESVSSSIATALLTGIIIKTNSFRSSNLSPRCLNNAGALIKLGGDRERIINALNTHKNLPTLNLWGRVLARLKTDSHYKLAWSCLNRTDFEKSGSNAANLNGIVDELIASSPTIDITLILFETEAGNIAGSIYTSKNYDSLYLTRELHGTGDSHQADFALSTTNIIEAEEIIVNKIRARIK